MYIEVLCMDFLTNDHKGVKVKIIRYGMVVDYFKVSPTWLGVKLDVIYLLG